MTIEFRDEKRFIGFYLPDQRIEYLGTFETYEEMKDSISRTRTFDDYLDIRDMDELVFEAELDTENEPDEFEDEDED